MSSAGDVPPDDGGGSFRPADTMDLDEDEDDNDARAEERVLVGGEGGDFVAQTLSTAEDVGEAIKRVQESGALSADASEAEPLLGLLGQLGMTRAEVYRSVLDDALAQLAERIKVMPQGTLLSLLDASFRYVTIEELRAVPLAVLERLKPVPSSYLKQISRDVELFRRLPVEVQRQCWELKGMLLRRHATPCLLAYGEETATTMRNLDLDLVLSPLNREEGWCVYPPGAAPPGSEPHGASRGVPGLPRRSLRRASASVQRLRRMVGDSKRLYLGVVALCRAHYAEHGVAAVCSLRSQLLMALHDDEMTDLCASDRVHRLAWLADACVRDRCLDGRRAAEMAAIVKQLDFDSKAGEREAAKAKRAAAAKAEKERRAAGTGTAAKRGGTRSKGLAPLKVTFGLGKKKEEKDSERADRDDDVAARREPERVAAPVRSVGGEAGNNTTERDDSDSDAPAGSMSRAANASDAANENLLGDVGMILRDPPVLSLLLHETVRTLEGVVEAERVPKSEPRLAELTRFLALACGARKLLRDRVPSLPQPPPQALTEFYPILGELLLESSLRDSDDEDEDEDEHQDQDQDQDAAMASVEVMGDDGEVRSEPAAAVSDASPSPSRARVLSLSRLMSTSEVIRKVALTYALRRLHAGDVHGARPVLEAAAEGGFPAAAEEAAFAVTLARRLASMLAGSDARRGAAPGTPLWRAAVDGLLLPACVAGAEPHEETLRLILAAAGGMTDESLATLVEATLHVTRKSRKTHRRRGKPVAFEHEPPAATRGVVAGRRGGLGLGNALVSSGDLAGYASGGGASGYGSGGAGTETDGSRGAGGADGVRATYQLLAQKEGARLTEAAAPKLHEYLARKDRRDMKRSGSGLGGRGDEDAEGTPRPFSP